jgi:hemerythrin-like domain-containing protein
MELTEKLVKEHVSILRGIDLLSRARDKIERNQYPPGAFFETAVVFFRNYADKYHHFKEEYLMFGFLAQKVGGELDLEIGALRHQHERCRGFLTRLERSINGYAMGNEIAVTSLLENLSAFISVLNHHIHMEDAIFFPLVEKKLSRDEKASLGDQFIREEERLRGGNHTLGKEDLLAKMEKLITLKGPL